MQDNKYWHLLMNIYYANHINLYLYVVDFFSSTGLSDCAFSLCGCCICNIGSNERYGLSCIPTTENVVLWGWNSQKEEENPWWQRQVLWTHDGHEEEWEIWDLN